MDLKLNYQRVCNRFHAITFHQFRVRYPFNDVRGNIRHYSKSTETGNPNLVDVKLQIHMTRAIAFMTEQSSNRCLGDVMGDLRNGLGTDNVLKMSFIYKYSSFEKLKSSLFVSNVDVVRFLCGNK